MTNPAETTIAVGQTALQDAALRAAAMLLTVPDHGVPVPGLDWTVTETAAHLVAEIEDYADFLTGDLDPRIGLALSAPDSTPTELSAASNRRQLEASAGLDLAELADRLVPAAEAFGAAASRRSDDEPVLASNGLFTTVPAMTTALLGEVLVHGFDIARAARLDWTIDPHDALAVLDGIMTMVPEYVDRQASAGIHVTYELRFRKGPRYRLSIDDGAAEVSGPGGKVDCWISADPVAFLLVGYGRIGQWGQILRGRMLAGGAKPWLGFKFGELLTGP
ncbi:MAG TPA: maleylpyruvate isomerase N-terminal domain-containing protein [Acidimicrobiales bacterium]|nr:maleylpyruvate isomerase N-terminal domain-containing protein [Acidimicrobiales bacterium]